MRKRRLKNQGPRGGSRARSWNPSDRTLRRIELAYGLALTVLIIILHVHRASRAGPLWRDEVGTLSMGTWPTLSQTWSFLVVESFPLLIYGLVRAWTAMGWPAVDMSLRILGAVVGIGGLVALWSAKRLVGHQVPILSLVLFGLNATVISWGDSVRAYGLAALLILLVYGLVWRVAVSPTPMRIGLAAFVSVLCVQSLYQNSFLVFAICVGGCLVCLRHGMWKGVLSILGIGAVAALSLVPYVPVIARSQPLFATVQFPFEFSHLLEIFAGAVSSGVDALRLAWLIGGAISIVVGCSFIFSHRIRDRGEHGHLDLALFSFTILSVGTVLFLLFLKASHLATEPWYYIVVMASIALSIDIAIELAAATPAKRVLRLVLATILAIITIPIAWDQTSLRQTNIDVLATHIGRQASQRDFVVVVPWFDGITFQHYYHGETSWTTAPPIRDLKLTRIDLLKEQMVLEHPLQPVFDGIERSLRTGSRVWVVGELSAPPEGQLPPSMPQAPNGANGWYSGDYLGGWNLQLGYFMKLHSLRGERVEVDLHQPVNPYEDVPLLVFSGWRS